MSGESLFAQSSLLNHISSDRINNLKIDIALTCKGNVWTIFEPLSV